MTGSSRSAGEGAKAGSNGILLADVHACVSEWSQLLDRGIRGQAPAAARLAGLSEELASRAQAVGFGGIGFHLTELLRHFRAADAGAARASLDVVVHLAEQARFGLSPAELQAMDRARAAGSSAVPAAVEPGMVAPPPLITNLGGPSPFSIAAQAAAHAASDAPRPPNSLRPPPLLNSDAPAPPAAPAPGPTGPAPRAPGGPGWEAVPVSRAPARASDGAQPAPPAPGAPNLFVRSMLGLRAFGKRPGTGEISSAPPGAVAPPPQAAQAPPLLNLRKHSSSNDVQRESGPPMRLDRLPSGLPPLADPPPHASHPNRGAAPRAQSESGSRMGALLGDIRRGRPSGQRPKLSRLAGRRSSEAGWKVGLLVGLGVLVALGGMVAVIVVLTRSRRDSDLPNPTAAVAAAASASAAASAAAGGELPQLRLSTDTERLRSLLAQVHGRGKESPELRALVDEHAALAAKALSPQKCEGSPLMCAEAAKIREAVLGKTQGRRVVKKRGAPSADRLRAAWMVGLKLPDIPVEDDPRVRRRFEFYTENPQGREVFQAMLFRCGAHRDLIQSTLIRYGLPTDILALVFAESGCEPRATSPVGAAGLWQFMPATARAYHLRVIEDKVDERRSPPKSTEAGVRFLRDMHEKLGSWELVFAGYNMGPFGVLARIEQAGGGDIGFWDLVDAEMLPDETADYVPAIQAIALILNNLQRLKFAGSQMRAPQLTSDLEVPPGTRLGLIARAAATSVTQLHALNLDISGEHTPNLANFAIQVPKDVVWQARDALKDLLSRRDDADQCVPPGFDWGRQRFTDEMAAACRRRLPGIQASPPSGDAPGKN